MEKIVYIILKINKKHNFQTSKIFIMKISNSPKEIIKKQ